MSTFLIILLVLFVVSILIVGTYLVYKNTPLGRGMAMMSMLFGPKNN